MVPSRPRSLSLLALLLGLLVAVGAVAAPAQATTTRKLALHASASTVGTGASVTFSGTLAPTPTGSSLELQILVGIHWLPARSVKTTTAAGAYSIAVPMPSYTGKYYLRTVAKASSGRSSATSNTVTITVLKKVTVSIKASTTSVDPGRPVTFTGHVSSCQVGASVALQRFSGSGWVRSSAATLTSRCNYLKTIHPTASASYRVSVAKHGTYAPAYSGSVRITSTGPAPTPPAITTAALPNGKRGVAYAFTLSRTGAAGTWAAANLPTGITLDAATGELSGTPTVEGDFAVGVTFTETASAKQASKILALHLDTSPPPVITTTTLPDAVKNVAYDQTLTRTGNAGTWAVTQGSLPPGVTLDAATGHLSGTPTAADDYGVTITFTETAAQTADSQGLLLHVSPAANSPSITTTSLVTGTVGAAYPTQQLQASGSGTWSISKFSLPPGLSLNALTGQITGTPTTAGNYLFQAKYTTLTGSNTKILTIHVDPAP